MENNAKIIGKLTFNDHHFEILEREDGKYLIGLLGKLASRNEFETKEEAEQYIQKKPWELITALACAVTTGIIEDSQQKQTNNHTNTTNN